MKKILIVTNQMNLGGTEKALIGLLKSIDPKKYNITLLLAKDGGDLQDEVPKWINKKIIPYFGYPIKSIIKKQIKDKQILNVVKSIYYYYKIRTSGHYEYYYYLSKIMPKLKDKYDIAISYFMPSEFPDYYVINNVYADKKITFVHSDISKLENINKKILAQIYRQFDEILGVSNDVCDIVCKNISGVDNKVQPFYNLVLEEEILKLSNEMSSFNDNFHGIRILTVGRLSSQKGQDLIPKICKKLIENNLNIKWYLIGDGYLKDTLRLAIKELEIENNLILLGAKKNPYPFIKDCDIYVQPSRCEGYATTITEAKILNKPILMTNVSSANEQILNKYNGLIVDIDESELYNAIKMLIENNELRNSFIKNLSIENKSNNQNMSKFYQIIEC